MPSDGVTEKEVAEELDYYGEYTVERKIEKRFGSNNIVTFKVDHNKYGYQRFENESLVVEKVIASDKPLVLGIFPVAPLNTPAKYGGHILLRVITPLVLDPKSHVDAYLTMPIEIGVVRSSESDVQIIDVFSVGQPKYALYGIPELGIICRYYETRINPEIPKAVPYTEAIVRVHFHNYGEKISTINRIVFPIEGADFYYKKNEAYYNDIEAVVQEKLLQTIIEINVANAQWVGEKTNLKQKFDGKYVMEWGF
ncbi:MAG: DUF432 domain-containing protein [Nitrososphaerales archaeon]